MSFRNQYYRLKRLISPLGTKDWLIGTEIKYGGRISNVPRNKVSPKDPRTQKQLNQGGMTGGDRMLHLNYAEHYAEYLASFINKRKKVVVAEFGILQGTGLAIWCDLFPKGTVFGFDIDLSHINNNLDRLKYLGAFKNNQPRLYEYDMYLNNTNYLGKILNGKKIDIGIDDGVHDFGTIINTLKSVWPYLADNFVYFIEDNEFVHRKIRLMLPGLKVEHHGLLTIVSKQV